MQVMRNPIFLPFQTLLGLEVPTYKLDIILQENKQINFNLKTETYKAYL